MGQLIDGAWSHEDLRAQNADGSFARPESPWRRWITADGSSGFRAEPGRYHLYVNVGCPWAYRTVLFRHLKGLQAAISMSCTHPAAGPEGWTFLDEQGRSLDEFTDLDHVHQVYTRADPKVTGRVTVPVLWDRERGTTVNNESAEIIRMMNSEFAGIAPESPDYYLDDLCGEIDEINERVYTDINNGVYRCGFAQSQDAYDQAHGELYTALERLEVLLGKVGKNLCSKCKTGISI